MPPKKRGAKRPYIFVAASITKKLGQVQVAKNNLLKEREVDVDEQEAQLRKDAEQRSSSSKEDEEEQSDSEEEEEGSKNNEEEQSGSEEDEEESKNDEEEKSNSEKDGEGSKNDGEEQREAKENEEEPSTEEADESQASMERRNKFLNDMDVQPAIVEESTSVSDLDDLPIPKVIKSINIEKYGFIMLVDMHENHEGSIVNRSMLGKGFSEFREILVKQKIYDDFKNSCFGHFLDLPESVICRFQMNLVHGLMFRRILSKKTKELWFIYNDMPVCFGLNEFALISGLKCHPLPPNEDLEKAKDDGEFLCDIVGKSATGAVLLKKIQKKLDKKVKVALSLLWFLHSVICAKDLNKVIEYDWLKLAFSPEVFNNYPWSRISYNITVGSLIQEVKPKKIVNLFGFPWEFMAWAFEAIPPVRKIFKNPPSEMSLPRITRWLSVKSKNVNFDPFQSSENMYVDEILCLMRIRHKKYPRHYDPKDIILDLNFYNYLKVAYKKIKDDSSVEGATPMTERLAKFEFNNDILNYVKGARPFPGGHKWDEAKRIFTVMTIGVRHYVALEFVIEEGKILVFDCNISATEETIFFTHIQPVLELWPKLLKQSGRFKHLSEKLLMKIGPMSDFKPSHTMKLVQPVDHMQFPSLSTSSHTLQWRT